MQKFVVTPKSRGKKNGCVPLSHAFNIGTRNRNQESANNRLSFRKTVFSLCKKQVNLNLVPKTKHEVKDTKKVNSQWIRNLYDIDSVRNAPHSIILQKRLLELNRFEKLFVNKDFTDVFQIKQLSRLSEREILIETMENQDKLVIHLPNSHFLHHDTKWENKRVAINRNLSIKLCDGLYWYLHWKVI